VDGGRRKLTTSVVDENVDARKVFENASDKIGDGFGVPDIATIVE